MSLCSENMQDFQYHAVVFYSENNEEEELFVQGDLLPRLENRWKYKICIPQRDFLIGASEYSGYEPWNCIATAFIHFFNSGSILIV